MLTAYFVTGAFVLSYVTFTKTTRWETASILEMRKLMFSFVNNFSNLLT